MHSLPDAMPDKGFYYRKTSGLHIALNRVGYIGNTVSQTRIFQTFIKGFFRSINQFSSFAAYISNGKCSGSISAVTLVKCSYINADNVAFLQGFIIGYAMNHLSID